MELRLVLSSVDCCVWPSNASYVANCFNAFNNILAMSPTHCGHVQLPVMQSQTSTEAWLKHRRMAEDILKKAGMDITVAVSLTFDKSSIGPRVALLVGTCSNEVAQVVDSPPIVGMVCAAATTGVIGPCQLIRVSDMRGFDPDNRFGAAARTEQPLASA